MFRYDYIFCFGVDWVNFYDEIIDKIIVEFEVGCFFWVQFWGKVMVQVLFGLLQNVSIGCVYSGINIFILWGVVVQYGFFGQGWFIFCQVFLFGGNVCKGECGIIVVYVDCFMFEDEKWWV